VEDNDASEADSGRAAINALLASTGALASRAKDDREESIAKGIHQAAKNKIAIAVIYSFCFSVLCVLLFIMYGAIFSAESQWKEAYLAMIDILQKVFVPVVTLAFGFYNSSKND
jgi:hypothetical protein